MCNFCFQLANLAIRLAQLVLEIGNLALAGFDLGGQVATRALERRTCQNRTEWPGPMWTYLCTTSRCPIAPSMRRAITLVVFYARILRAATVRTIAIAKPRMSIKVVGQRFLCPGISQHDTGCSGTGRINSLQGKTNVHRRVTDDLSLVGRRVGRIGQTGPKRGAQNGHFIVKAGWNLLRTESVRMPHAAAERVRLPLNNLGCRRRGRSYSRRADALLLRTGHTLAFYLASGSGCRQ